MCDIRLKKITVDGGSLTISSGKVVVINSATDALSVNGGIASTSISTGNIGCGICTATNVLVPSNGSITLKGANVLPIFNVTQDLISFNPGGGGINTQESLMSFAGSSANFNCGVGANSVSSGQMYASNIQSHVTLVGTGGIISYLGGCTIGSIVTSTSGSVSIGGELSAGNITYGVGTCTNVFVTSVANIGAVSSANIFISQGILGGCTVSYAYLWRGQISNLSTSYSTIASIVNQTSTIGQMYVSTSGYINNLSCNSVTVPSLVNQTLYCTSGVINRLGANSVSTGILVANGCTLGSLRVTAESILAGFTSSATSLVAGDFTVSGLYSSISNSLFVNSTTQNVRVTGSLSVNATNSSSTLFVSGGSYVSGLSQFGSEVHILNTTGALGVGSGGSLTVYGGLSVAQTAYLGGGLDVSGEINANSTTDATGLGSGGSLTVYGGVSVSRNAYFGASVNAKSLICESTQNSVSVSSGALTIMGGIAIAKDVYIGGTTYLYGDSVFAFGYSTAYIDPTATRRFVTGLTVGSYDYTLSRYNSTGVFIDNPMTVSATTGAVTFNSGAYMKDIYIQSTSATSVYISGGTSMVKGLTVGGDSVFGSTTQSANHTTGALVVYGGIGVSKNLNVFGDTVLSGNLTVNGTMTSLTSVNTVLKDNLLVFNSAPAGTRNSGFIVNRYQTSNDSGSGDVVSDTVYVNETLPLQTGMSTTQLKLSSAQSNVDNYYNGWWVMVTSGFDTNQVRQIVTYTGSTRTATIAQSWTTQNPTIGDTIRLYYRPYVGLVFNETDNVYELGSTLAETSANLNSLITFRANTLESTLGSIAQVICTSTQESLGINTLGSLSVLGGGSVYKSLYVGGSLYVNGTDVTPNTSTSFTAANNQISPVTTGITFASSVSGFDTILIARLTTSTSILCSNYHIRGINKGTGWDAATSYVGDDLGIIFSMSGTSGNVLYTSQNTQNFVSLVFKYNSRFI